MKPLERKNSKPKAEVRYYNLAELQEARDVSGNRQQADEETMQLYDILGLKPQTDS